MPDFQNPNVGILLLCMEQLGDLRNEMVFVGGCATGLLITDPAAAPMRITRDVDVIVEIASLVQYYRLSDELRLRGFQEDNSEGAPICRWRTEHVILDVMPTDENVLNFGNEWYPPALEHAQIYEVQPGEIIRLISAPYFLATKLAAFESRGGGDFLASHDMEDIITVIDGRPGIVEEVLQADPDLKHHLKSCISSLLANHRFVEAIPGHIGNDGFSPTRLPLVLQRLEAIIRNDEPHSA
jgi:hypothetical protein